MLFMLSMTTVTQFHVDISRVIYSRQVFSKCLPDPKHGDAVSQILGSSRSYRNTDEMWHSAVLANKTVNQKNSECTVYIFNLSKPSSNDVHYLL